VYGFKTIFSTKIRTAFVATTNSKDEVFVFPNPSKGKLFILTKNPSKITLMDAQGKEVSLSKNKLSDNLVELTCICENGLYQLIIIENEKITVKKIEFFK
jgi:hypothetical protein